MVLDENARQAFRPTGVDLGTKLLGSLDELELTVDLDPSCHRTKDVARPLHPTQKKGQKGNGKVSQYWLKSDLFHSPPTFFVLFCYVCFLFFNFSFPSSSLYLSSCLSVAGKRRAVHKSHVVSYPV